jgi:hypothetical protein
MKIVLSVAMVLFGTLAVEPSLAKERCTSSQQRECNSHCESLSSTCRLFHGATICKCKDGKEFTLAPKPDESKAPAGKHR